MASPLPLTPTTEASLNLAAPAITNIEEYEVQTYTTTTEVTDENKLLIPGDQTEASSPFLSHVNDTQQHVSVDQENQSPVIESPTKNHRHSRVLSGTELSPLKLASKRMASRDPSPERGLERTASGRSPRKMSPEKRFPVKISGSFETSPSLASPPIVSPGVRSTGNVSPIMAPPATAVPSSPVKTMDLDQAMKENEGLKKAIEIFEDEHSEMDVDTRGAEQEQDEPAGVDDTMMSTFSTFSAVPTMYSKSGASPGTGLLSLGGGGGRTPRARAEPSPASPSRRVKANANNRDSEGTTNLLIDFTESLRHPGSRSPSKRSPTKTPSRNSNTLSNLLDFDIPPMPTPRSVPSITPRELESLKSKFLSEISSLKASLSGKEAEVTSLKTAVTDAEKRVGESMEQMREERAKKEMLQQEVEDWESRGKEMEGVLRKVRGEIHRSEGEREELERKVEESERRREAAEVLHQEAESRIAGMRAGKDAATASPEKAKSPEASNKDVEVAVERVARELHGLYKSKHETKVAALKKSYEARWEKKLHALEQRIEDLHEENEKLRRDNTLTKVDPNATTILDVEERAAKSAADGAAIKELEADVVRVEAMMESVQRDNEELRGLLERERVEKGELVQLAEEMMAMQSFVGGSSVQTPVAAPTGSSSSSSVKRQQQAPRMPENQPPSMPSVTPGRELKTPKAGAGNSRMSALRTPGTTGLRMPAKSGGLPRAGGRSGIMNSIEQMGSYGRRQ